MRLENWSVVSPQTDPYKAPELCSLVLRGNVYGHPNFEDGKEIITSTIVETTDDGKIKTYSGNVYELGEVDPEYERLYPNSRERIFSNG